MVIVSALLMGVLYPARGGLSSPLLVGNRFVAVEDPLRDQVADLTLREVRGGAEDRSNWQIVLGGDIVADAAKHGHAGHDHLVGDGFSPHDAAEALSNEVKVTDQFGVREVETGGSGVVAVHIDQYSNYGEEVKPLW